MQKKTDIYTTIVFLFFGLVIITILFGFFANMLVSPGQKAAKKLGEGKNEEKEIDSKSRETLQNYEEKDRKYRETLQKYGVGLPTKSLPDNTYEPTPKQNEFASTISGTPRVLNVEWQAPLSLWVKVSLNALGFPPKEKAKEITDMISNAGEKALDQGLCVHVYYGNYNELAKSCSY